MIQALSTTCAHVFHPEIELYNFDPNWSHCFDEMRWRCFYVFMSLVHCLFHWVFAMALICWIREDFKGGCLNDRCIVESVAALCFLICMFIASDVHVARNPGEIDLPLGMMLAIARLRSRARVIRCIIK
jgi:hypothetical protein